MRCVGALLVRNEAAPDRYLQRVLDNAALYCDEIVVVDDGSTDDTAAICMSHPKVSHVERLGSEGWWGAGRSEAPARERLWRLAAQKAGPHGWVYLFDADHELLGIEPAEFRALLRSQAANCWALVLWDTWDDENLQRVDGHWQAWHLPRPWLFRAQPTPTFEPSWNGRQIHVGHAPINYPMVPGLMPMGAGIRHLGYLSKAHRLKKWHAYTNLGLLTKESHANGQTDPR